MNGPTGRVGGRRARARCRHPPVAKYRLEMAESSGDAGTTRASIGRSILIGGVAFVAGAMGVIFGVRLIDGRAGQVSVAQVSDVASTTSSSLLGTSGSSVTSAAPTLESDTNSAGSRSTGAGSNSIPGPDAPGAATSTTLPLCSDYFRGCGGEPTSTTSTIPPCVLPRYIDDPFIAPELGEVIAHVREVYWIASCGEMRWDNLQCHDPSMPSMTWRFFGFHTRNEGNVKLKIARNIWPIAGGVPCDDGWKAL